MSGAVDEDRGPDVAAPVDKVGLCVRAGHGHLGGVRQPVAVVLQPSDEFGLQRAVGLADQLLWSWFGTVVTFNVKATNAANSTSNPEYQTSVLVSKMSPVAGKVGDLANQDLTWKVAATVVRATS